MDGTRFWRGSSFGPEYLVRAGKCDSNRYAKFCLVVETLLTPSHQIRATDLLFLQIDSASGNLLLTLVTALHLSLESH